MNEKSLRVRLSTRGGVVYVILVSVRRQRKEERGKRMLFCVHKFVIFGPLFLSLKIYFPPCVFFCWFFLPHFFVTLLHKDKKCCLGGNNNTPLPTTTRSIKWATNSRRTRRECRCATPSSPLSVFFFCSRASESFTFFFKRDDAMSSSLAEKSLLRFAKDSHKEIFVSSFEIARCN